MNENNNQYSVGAVIAAECTIVTIFSLIGPLKAQYKLYKEENRQVTLVRIPENLFERNDKSRRLKKIGIKMRASKCVNEFIATLKNVPHIDLTALYDNFQDFGIELCQTKKQNDVKGIHSFINNKILVADNEVFEESLFHELLHLSSSRHVGKWFFAGFRLIETKIEDDKLYVINSIGIGLNEGYTELLNRRYFHSKRAYPEFVRIAKMVENIVGQARMESLYFKSDLCSLVQDLSAYGNLEKAIALIKKIDHLYNALYRNKYFIPRILAKQTYKEIVNLLCEMTLEKCLKTNDFDDFRRLGEFPDEEVMLSNKLFGKICYKPEKRTIQEYFAKSKMITLSKS